MEAIAVIAARASQSRLFGSRLENGLTRALDAFLKTARVEPAAEFRQFFSIRCNLGDHRTLPLGLPIARGVAGRTGGLEPVD